MRITHLSMAFCSLGGRCPLLGRSILWCFPAFSCGGKAFRYERYANLTPPKRKGMEIISYKQHILTACHRISPDRYPNIGKSISNTRRFRQQKNGFLLSTASNSLLHGPLCLVRWLYAPYEGAICHLLGGSM